VSPDRPQAALLIAALLSRCPDLGHRVRSAIIERASLEGLGSRGTVVRALTEAFHSVGLTLSPRRYPREDSIRRAAAEADEWIRRGIFVLGPDQSVAPGAELHELPPLRFAWGNVSALERPAAAFLNSRKPRHPRPHDEWIRSLQIAVRSALPRGFAVASSFGTLGYALVSLLAKASPMIVACDHVLPFMGSQEVRNHFLTEFGDLFDMGNTLFLSTFPPGRVPEKAARWSERDHLVAASASLIFAADPRPGGNVERILRIAAKRHVPVETLPAEVGPASRPRGKPPHTVIDPGAERLNDTRPQGSATALRPVSVPTPETDLPVAENCVAACSYLVHYTRSCPGPWPGQTVAQYCRSLVDEDPGAAHTAFDALFRILQERMIRASRRLTRGDSAVVCFTELFPRELRRLSAWRPGLLRRSFEPYGVALKKEPLFTLGARPVIYAVDATFEDLNGELRHLFQLQTTHGTNWAEEKEWRIRGDLHLATIDPRDMFAIVTTAEEARIVADTFGCRVALPAMGMGKCDGRGC
jgi:hypothetical protein